MKTKYIIIALLISIFNMTLGAANTYTVDQNYTISLTTGYVNNMNETWNVVSTVTDKPLLITYSIGTESNYDFLTINNVDNNGVYTSQLLRISGTQSGTISTLVPNGRIMVVFTSDGSASYANNNSLYSGINVSFSVNYNNIVNGNQQFTGNSFVSGKLGIGTFTPSAGLQVAKSYNYNGSNIAAILGDNYNDWTNFGGVTGGRIRGDNNGYLVLESNPNGTGDKNLYLNFASTGNILIARGGGNVGIGTGITSPAQALDIEKNADYQLRLGNTAGQGYNIGRNGTTGFLTFYGDQSGYNGYSFGGVNGEKMRIDANGSVGIGTTPNALYKLDVKGAIRASEVQIVSLDNFADFVFEKNYKLPKLSEINAFIQINGHLPNIPSATEVKENGMSLVEMQVKLLQKIEELTLYAIEQQKRIEQLEKNQK